MIQTLGIDDISALNGASCVVVNGALEVTTPQTPWAYALVVPVTPARGEARDVVAIRTAVDLEVLRGEVGIFAAEHSGDYPLGREVIVNAASGRTIIYVDGSPHTTRVCIRNGAASDGRMRLHSIAARPQLRFDISAVIEDVMTEMLRQPGRASLETIAAAITNRNAQVVSPEDIGALECRRAPIAVPFERLWHDEIGQIVRSATDALLALMPTYDPACMDPRNGYLGREFFSVYLKQSTIRVYHLLNELRTRGQRPGSVLEVGSLFGQFALCLQRIGYRVTVIDRYRTYGGAFGGYVEFLRREGIDVIETDRTAEQADLARLGHFDTVLSMAVIEHIPHTPREFLRMLASHVRPGGTLAVDTPNIARYWNRRRLAAGYSIHQEIEKQFFADIPYEGHHREYTESELIWMLRQIGCAAIGTRLFDYNLLQFPELSGDHLDALLAMTVDPSLADTILAVARVDT